MDILTYLESQERRFISIFYALRILINIILYIVIKNGIWKTFDN